MVVLEGHSYLPLHNHNNYVCSTHAHSWLAGHAVELTFPFLCSAVKEKGNVLAQVVVSLPVGLFSLREGRSKCPVQESRQ